MKKIIPILLLIVLCTSLMIPTCFAMEEGVHDWQYTFGDFFADHFLQITGVALIITIIVGVVLIVKHNSANRQIAAQTYLQGDGYYKIHDKKENYESTYTKVQKNYYKESSSSSSTKNGPKQVKGS